MLTTENVIEFLERNKLKNINMINFIENNPIYYMERFKDSLMIKGKSDENWVYISSSSEEELESLLRKCEEDKFFVVTEDWMMPFILKNKEVEWKLSCVKLIFPEEKKLPECRHEIDQLKISEVEYIFHNSKYKDYTSIEYITSRIKNGTALGIYDEDKLVAWLMTHDDGAIGFLNVLPEYRKRGYGYELTIKMINQLRKLKKIPFVHIEEDNYKSMNLALKTGFIKDKEIHWIKIK